MTPTQLRFLLLLVLVGGCGSPNARSRMDGGDASPSAPMSGTKGDAGRGADGLDGHVPEHTDSGSGSAIEGGRGEAEPAYTLIAPMGARTTYLIDSDGQTVHRWPSDYPPGLAVYLLDDGSILRTANVGRIGTFIAGGISGRVERIGWDGQLLWAYDYLSAEHRSHHDVEPMPNGNVLLVAWEAVSESDAVAEGRATGRIDGQGLWPETLIEVEPEGADGGRVVWKWRSWDHLGTDSAHIDINGGGRFPDWMHINAVDYHTGRDEIVVSVLGFDEFWILDHGISTADARGQAGDILYRWGGGESGSQASVDDGRLYGLHDAHWIPDDLPGAGHILLFQNGSARPDGDYSSVDEYELPMADNGGYRLGAAADLAWQYVAPEREEFYSAALSGAQRLADGTTLVCEGTPGRLSLLSANGATTWSYQNPIVRGTTDDPGARPLFRATQIPAEHPALAGRSLIPDGPVAP